MKKILSMFIAIGMALSMSVVFAEDLSYVDENGVEFQYTVKDNEAYIQKVNTNKVQTVIIPAELGGAPVYDLPERMLETAKGVTEIKIEDGVRSIGPHCFSNCKSLKKVTMQNSVTSIGEFAFNSCEQLEEITLSAKLKEIQRQAFGYCTELKTINLPSGLEVIGDNAFSSCRNIENFSIPSTVKSIGEMAFDGCNLSEELVLPSKLESVGYWAFQGWINLKKVNIPSGVTEYLSGVFMGDTALKNILFEGLAGDKYRVLSHAVYGMDEPDLTTARKKTSEDVKVKIDGQELNFDGTRPYIDVNYRTQIPLRAVSEKLGYEVEWKEAEREVLITKGNEQCSFKIENRVAFGEGDRVVIMDTAPVIVDDYTYIPLRYFGEILNKSVEWDGSASTVIIDSTKPYVK